MKTAKNIIIGFGKGGKTLAGSLASAGQSVILIEESEQMFGGTCINVACIPTKAMEYSARLSRSAGGDFKAHAERYSAAVNEKAAITAALREKNYEKAVSAGVEVVVGSASFIDSTHVAVRLKNGSSETISGERFFINTGSRPFIPPIDGIKGNRFVYTSEQLLALQELPARLAIIGGGYIGLEFASFYRNFGSEVTIIQDSDTFIPREDREVADKVLESFKQRGINVLFGAKTLSISEAENNAVITLEMNGKSTELAADAVLVATGRRPNIEGLSLRSAGVELNDRGAIKTDDRLRTTAKNIWALGDVAGGLQFTYISLDDSRIINSQLFGDGSRTTANRGSIPYSVFLDPPFSRVGMTEADAVNSGHKVKIARLAAAAIPKARVLRQSSGMLKAVIDAETGLILGAHLFCVDSHEIINIVKLAIDCGIPYTALRDAVYTHPTMSEALNDLLGSVK